MNLQQTIELTFGGPGSGCQGPNCGRPSKPSVKEVLEKIAKDVVVVGSVAKGKINPKDIDLVVKSRGKADKNIVFKQLFKEYPEHTDSEVTGHVIVKAHPLVIELFESGMFLSIPHEPNKKTVTYKQALANSEEKEIFGVKLRVYKG